MKIQKIKVKNYKSLRDVEVEFKQKLCVIVADNEAGKSSILEAINLALNCQLHGRHIRYDLHPFLFNLDVTNEYLSDLNAGNEPHPPSIVIEVFFEECEDLAKLRGAINSEKSDAPGVTFSLEFDPKNEDEYKKYIAEPSEVTAIPVEFLRIVWRSFADSDLEGKGIAFKPTLIDASTIRHDLGASRYLIDEVSRHFNQTDRAKLSLSYRKMKDKFLQDDNVKAINEELKTKTGSISNKTLSMGLDNTARARWEAGVMPHLDEIPFPLIGKGEQSSVKIRLALDASETSGVVLIEEPENHLSHTNLNALLSVMEESAVDTQLIVTTHNTFVLNKLGVSGVVLFDGAKGMTLEDLSTDTTAYFKKLSGHDTLRFILAKRVILVEGPSDELIVQKAYLAEYGVLPIADGTEVITVNSLAFERFLQIAKILNIDTRVVTDNDGRPDKLSEKYQKYDDERNINICFDDDINYPTLEPQLLKSNGLEMLNGLFDERFDNDESLLKYMAANKTECALKLFESDAVITFPEYIKHAITK